MKINMWMIANMLRNENIEIDIHSNLKYDLFGVSLTREKGCGYLEESGTDVLCLYENNCIVYKNCTIINALIKLQRIFNFYNEWKAHIISLCREGTRA